MTPLHLFWILLVSGILAGVGAVVFRRSWDSPARWIAIPAAAGLAIGFLDLYRMLVAYWNVNWDAARLLPPIAWTRGYQIYSTLEGGSIQTTMYPPGWVWSYLPVAGLNDPTRILVTGYALSLAYVYLPALVLFVRKGPTRWAGLFGFTVFVAWSTREMILMGSFRPHPDPPSLGFALLAVWLVVSASRKDSNQWFRLAASAFFCTLCVWTKQVMVPVIPALLLWCLWVGGWRLFRKYFLLALVTGLVQGTVALLLFSARGVIFNIFTIPSQVAFTGPTLQVLSAAAKELFSAGWISLLIVAAGMLLSLVGIPRRIPWGEVTRSTPVLLVLTGLACVPTSLLGRAKIGGFPNTLSPALYFWVVAACFTLAVIAGEVMKESRGWQRFVFIPLTSVGMVLFVAWWGQQLHRGIKHVAFANVRANTLQRAVDHLSTSEGRSDSFFPTLPLAHLLAEGWLPHYASSVFDREVLAGFPIDPSQRNDFPPERTTTVYWLEPQWGLEYVVPHYFSDFTPAPPDLKGFRKTVR